MRIRLHWGATILLLAASAHAQLQPPVPSMPPQPAVAPNANLKGGAPAATSPAVAAPVSVPQRGISVGSGKFKVGYEGRGDKAMYSKYSSKLPASELGKPNANPVNAKNQKMQPPVQAAPAPVANTTGSKMRSDSKLSSDSDALKPAAAQPATTTTTVTQTTATKPTTTAQPGAVTTTVVQTPAVGTQPAVAPLAPVPGAR